MSSSQLDENSSISISKLLSACVDAALRGCHEIRTVQNRTLKSKGSYDRKVTMKLDNDPRSALTEADVKAQAMIIGCLRKTYGTFLNIVGEEDGNEDATPLDTISLTYLNNNLVQFNVNEKDDIVPLKDVCIFVDPVDGTREFVEGRLHAVQCLIGISLNGRAIAGAIGLPFPRGAEGFNADSEDPNATSVIYGLVGSASDNDKSDAGLVGCYNENLRNEIMKNSDKDTLVITTGDSSNSLLNDARNCVFKVAESLKLKTTKKIQGGAGNKLLDVAEGGSDVALMNFTTCLWDTCAPEAIVKAAGGKVTDIFGSPLTHKFNAKSVMNHLGVIGSMGNDAKVSHNKICEEIRKNKELAVVFNKQAGFKIEPTLNDSSQAFDIARSLDGTPLTVEFLNEKIISGINNKRKHDDDNRDGSYSPSLGSLNSYTVNDEDSVRGLMSDAVRLELNWENTKAEKCLPNSIFYKRVDMQNLAHMRLKQKTAPMKIDRDVRSFYVESAFLASNAARALTNAGVGVPRCYDSSALLNENQSLDSKFAMVLEDFSPKSGWFQSKSLNKAEAICAVEALARMHAFFLPDSNYRKSNKDNELENSIWPSGAYWQPSMQTMEEQVANLPERWENHLKNFQTEIKEAKIEITSVGKKLQSIANLVGKEAFPFTLDNKTGIKASDRLMRQRTFVHGDPKAGNIFLKQKDSNKQGYSIAFIDFQWCGFGLPGVDLGHFICASVNEETLEDNGESLIDAYYTAFINSAKEFGIPSPETELLTKNELREQSEAAILDTMRCIFAYQWVRTPANPAMLEKNKNSIGRNSYNKSLFNALWVMKRCDELLVKRGI